MNGMNSTEEEYIQSDTHSSLKFHLFLISAIASILCTLFLFYHFISNIKLRRSIYNHVPFFLLFITFLTLTIPLPFSLYFFENTHSLIQTNLFCSFLEFFSIFTQSYKSMLNGIYMF
jgi:hypothetical protein